MVSSQWLFTCCNDGDQAKIDSVEDVRVGGLVRYIVGDELIVSAENRRQFINPTQDTFASSYPSIERSEGYTVQVIDDEGKPKYDPEETGDQQDLGERRGLTEAEIQLISDEQDAQIDMPFEAAVALGLTGLAGPIEGVRCALSDRGETTAFVELRLLEAQLESGPQLFLVLSIITNTGFRVVAATTPFLLVSSVISLLSVSFSLSTYSTSEMTPFAKRVRDELTKSKVTSLGFLVYYSADIALRVQALGIMQYAIGDFLLPVVLVAPITFVAWIIYDARIEGVAVWLPKAVFWRIANFVRAHIAPPLVPAASVRELTYDASWPTVLCAASTLVALLPFMPHPHRDPDFRDNMWSLLLGGIACKALSFILFVAPALAERQVLGASSDSFTKADIDRVIELTQAEDGTITALVRGMTSPLSGVPRHFVAHNPSGAPSTEFKELFEVQPTLKGRIVAVNGLPGGEPAHRSGKSVSIAFSVEVGGALETKKIVFTNPASRYGAHVFA